MMQADAFAAEDSKVIAAVEVFDALGMFLAQLLLQRIFILIDAGSPVFLEVEVGLREDWVLLDHLVQNVNVQRQSFC